MFNNWVSNFKISSLEIYQFVWLDAEFVKVIYVD